MKKWMIGIVALVAMVALVSCPNDNGSSGGGNGTEPPPPEVLEFQEIVPDDWWRPVRIRAYLEIGLSRSVQGEREEPCLDDLLEAYCAYFGPLDQGYGTVEAYVDANGDGALPPWELVYDYQYGWDGSTLTIADWGIPFTVKDVSADGWTMRVDGDPVELLEDFLECDLDMDGIAYIEVDWENCRPIDLQRGRCLTANDWSIDQDQWDLLPPVYKDAAVLGTETKIGWGPAAVGSHPALNVVPGIGVLYDIGVYWEGYEQGKNGTPELNKLEWTIGPYKFVMKPASDRVAINPGLGNIQIFKGAVKLGESEPVPFAMTQNRKWLDAEIYLSTVGVGMRVEAQDGGPSAVLMIPGEDATGSYSSVSVVHRTGTDALANEYQMKLWACVDIVPAPEDCGCEDK